MCLPASRGLFNKANDPSRTFWAKKQNPARNMFNSPIFSKQVSGDSHNIRFLSLYSLCIKNPFTGNRYAESCFEKVREITSNNIFLAGFSHFEPLCFGRVCRLASAFICLRFSICFVCTQIGVNVDFGKLFHSSG